MCVLFFSEDIRTAISNVNYLRGTTNTGQAISYVKDMFQNQGGRNGAQQIAVILTDGGSNNKQATFA